MGNRLFGYDQGVMGGLLDLHAFVSNRSDGRLMDAADRSGPANSSVLDNYIS